MTAIKSTIDHSEYEHCCFLLNDYIQYGKIESLLTLYSMETPFYYRILIKINPLAFPFFIHLSDLKQRYYQGYAYRNIHMTPDDLAEYYFILKNPNNILSTQTFVSTSIVREIAEENVLLIFYFPQVCDTAINFSKIRQYQLPCISHYENESEVLIAPRTFFKIQKIEINPLNKQHIIHLENICSEQKSILKTVTFFLKQDLKNRLRH